MYIHKLTIHLCNRFKLSNDDTFIFTFNKPITVITGISGIGKSTILEYILPFPVDKSDFSVGGYREVELTYGESTYIITSNYKGHHSLTKDGVQITKGTTRKEFMLTVEEYFNLNLDIFKIVTSRKQFTTTSLSDRKEWLSLISIVDMEFAFKLFKSVTTSIRDLSGNVKILESKLTELEVNDKLKGNIVRLENEVTELESVKDELLSIHFDTFDRDLNLELKTLTSVINKTILKIDDTIMQLDEELLTSRLNRVTTLIEVNKSKVDRLSAYDGIDIDTLNKEIDALAMKINDIEIANLYNIPSKYISTTLAYFKQIDFMGIISSLDRLKVEVDNIDEFNTTRSVLINKVRFLKDDINKHTAELDYILRSKNGDDTNCPRCNFTFKPNYTPKVEKALIKKLEELNGEYDVLNKRLEHYNAINTTIEGREVVLERLTQIINSNTHIPCLKSLNLNLLNNNLSDEVSTMVNGILSYLETAKTLPDILEEFKYKTEQLSLLESINRDKIKKANKLLRIYDKQYSRLLNIQFTYEKLLKSKKEQLIQYSKLDGFINGLDSILAVKDKYLLYKRGIIIKDIANKIINKLNLKIKDLRNRLSDIKEVDNKYTIYTKNIHESKLELNKLVKIKNALDPKNGLIARSVQSFLGYIIDEVNAILSSIFMYDIYIDIDTEHIDYKFKLVVKGRSPVSDISLGSGGQQEIINMAFLIVTYKMLKLPFPLLLDEIGNRLDQHHRREVFKYITEMSEEMGNQIYIVSHYDVNQIEDANIDVIKL